MFSFIIFLRSRLSSAKISLKNLGHKIALISATHHVINPIHHHHHHSYYNNNYQSGYYYDYNYRNGYENVNGSLCSNNQTYDGVIFGQFICPIEGKLLVNRVILYYDIISFTKVLKKLIFIVVVIQVNNFVAMMKIIFLK